jgi:hypothetical protein
MSERRGEGGEGEGRGEMYVEEGGREGREKSQRREQGGGGVRE